MTNRFIPAALAACLGLMALGRPAAAADWPLSTDPKDAPPVLDREFRGVWVATVANIDWPSKPGLPVKALREEMTTLLDAAAAANLNAVLLQVRPACDAMYPSQLEPWSEFLTGRSGQPPQGAGPDYDPLSEWIAAAHARGLELHAWINPFRARHFESKQPDAPSHVSRTHPEWVKSYDSYLWLDPGEPGAREHTLRVALDIVNRYPVDGLHFDDYFYPYPKEKQPFPDDASFAATGGGVSRPDWRRRNIDTFVSELYLRVKQVRPGVKVGISPFGIWRPGSPPPVRGFDAYDGLFADARRWLREGWLDYASPQLYWKLDAPQQPFARLLDWWVDQNDQSRHLWPGLNASRVLAAGAIAKDGKPAASWEPPDVVGQIEATRRAGGAGGTVLFSMIAIRDNRRGLADALKRGVFAKPALVPPSPWLRAPIGIDASGPGARATPPAAPRVSGLTENPTITVQAGTDTRWWGVWTRRGPATGGPSGGGPSGVGPSGGGPGAGDWTFTLRAATPAGAAPAQEVQLAIAPGRPVDAVAIFPVSISAVGPTSTFTAPPARPAQP